MKMRWIFALLVSLSAMAHPYAGASAQDDAGSGLSLDWAAPAFELTTVRAEDGQRYAHIALEDPVEAEAYAIDGAPGEARLPRRSQLISLPPSGDFGIKVIDIVTDTLSLRYPVEPVPAPVYPQLDDGAQQPEAAAIPAHTGTDVYPDSFLNLEEPVWMRDHRLVRLVFAPFRYHPQQGRLEIVRRVRFRIWWERPKPVAAGLPPDPFQELLARSVLNSGDLDAFRSPEASRAAARALDLGALHRDARQLVAPGASSIYKLLINSEGVYALDYATLSAAGLPLQTIDPGSLRLSHAATEIAAQWEGDGDATFEAGERLLFYARPQLTRYAGYDVYWLTWGGAAGQRMASRGGDPSGLAAGTAWAQVLAEQNAEYDSQYADRAGDHWFWRRLKLPDVVDESFQITLAEPASTAAAQLTLWFHSLTTTGVDPDHHVQVSVNGTQMEDARWKGAVPYTATLNLPGGSLQAGPNTIGLKLPGDTGSGVEGTWLDAMAIRYGLAAVDGNAARFSGESGRRMYTLDGFTGDGIRVYDVSQPDAPRIVTGFTRSGGTIAIGDDSSVAAEYLVLSEEQIQPPAGIVPTRSLIEPVDGADYLIVTPSDFETALEPLIAHRQSQGLRVAVANVEAIYDQFGDGRMDPTAIRSFLAHAYADWPGPPLRYVLLVGDATYDPRHYRPDTNPTYLPPYLVDVDPELGETTSDNRYADYTGDLLPDVFLGRFPVNTAAETEAVVDKILRYETDPAAGLWSQRLLFGADNPSTAGDHHAHADSEFNTYAVASKGYAGTRVYLSTTPGAPYLYTDAEAAQEALIAALNRGALLYSYFGHASWHQEAVLETDNYAPLFHRDHIARLANQGRWPVVLHMTCLTGRYTHPSSDTLDESLLRARDVGAIAVWGSSGSGVATGHRILHRSFYQAVVGDGQTQVSAAIHGALTDLFASGAYDDLIETFHLFGDPALKLYLTAHDLPFSTFLPIMARNE
jgi:hypothetical protein